MINLVWWCYHVLPTNIHSNRTWPGKSTIKNALWHLALPWRDFRTRPRRWRRWWRERLGNPSWATQGAMVHHRSKQNGAIMGLGSPTVQHNKQQCCHWHPTQICLWLSMHVQQLFNLIPRILISKIPLGSTLRIWKSLGSPSPTGNERQTENIVFHRCFPFPAHENSSKFHGRWKHIKTYKNSDSWVWIVRIPGFQPNTRRQVSHRILPLDWWRSSRDVRLPTSWGENIPLPIQNGVPQNHLNSHGLIIVVSMGLYLYLFISHVQ